MEEILTVTSRGRCEGNSLPRDGNWFRVAGAGSASGQLVFGLRQASSVVVGCGAIREGEDSWVGVPVLDRAQRLATLYSAERSAGLVPTPLLGGMLAPWLRT